MLTNDERDRVAARLDVIELRLDEIIEQLDQVATSVRAIARQGESRRGRTCGNR